MKCCVLLLYIGCMIASSNQVWILRVKNYRFRAPHIVLLQHNQLIPFPTSNQNDVEVNKLLDSFEQNDGLNVPNFTDKDGFSFEGFRGTHPGQPHRFRPNRNHIHSFNPHLRNHQQHIFQHPIHHSGLQPLRPPSLADGFDPNLHRGFHPTRKQEKVPFFHLGFLPSPTPQLTFGSGTKKSKNIPDDDSEIIHSEIHDINNASLDSHDFHDFRYEGFLGPSHWSELFPDCNGTHQSPVAIFRQNTVHVNYGDFISRNYYTISDNGTITNNGHTAMVTLPGGATISGGGLPGEFEFLNFHFHWGSDDQRGSEHVLEGVRYPLELHIVHWNLKYKSADKAMHHPDGIAVLAVLFHVEPLENPYMTPLINALKKVVPSNTNMTFTPNFRLSDFLPVDTRDFYRYEGSLTTPECSESVIWTIFANTLSISEGQLNVFRDLLDADNHDRENNHRPVQPLNDRIIYQNGR